MGNLLGKKIVIVNDSFEQHLPMGMYGYVIARIRDQNSAFDYVIRVPNENRQYYVPSDDIELEEILLQKTVEEIEKQALIDYALKTRNKELFDQLIKEIEEPEQQESKQDSTEDFMRKVRQNAYI